MIGLKKKEKKHVMIMTNGERTQIFLQYIHLESLFEFIYLAVVIQILFHS